jgi:hypothetical protein
LKSIVIVHCPSASASIAASRLSLLTKFIDATTKHTEMRCFGAASSTSSKLLQKHHVCHNQNFYENVVISLPANHNEFLFIDFNKILHKLFEQGHQVGFLHVTRYSRAARIACMID